MAKTPEGHPVSYSRFESSALMMPQDENVRGHVFGGALVHLVALAHGEDGVPTVGLDLAARARGAVALVAFVVGTSAVILSRTKPAFVLDITPHIDAKMSAIRCYESQFVTGRNSSPPTILDDIRDRRDALR